MADHLTKSLLIPLLLLLLLTGVSAQDRAAEFRAAADYSKANRGVAMVVYKGEDLVFEEYFGGGSAGIPWPIASGTKSFSGVMLACAIEDKIISGFDEKVSDTFPEWKTDPRKSRITVRQLLSLTSGINAGRVAEAPTYSDAVGYAAVAEPGKEFDYGPVPFQIFGELMTRKLRTRKESVLDYMERRILGPLGITVGFWRKRGESPMLPSGMALTAKEWAKFGRLLRDGGMYRGERLVREELLKELLSGSAANPAYGVSFWLNRKGINSSGRQNMGLFETQTDESLGKDIFMAAGAGFQRLYVIPSRDLVVVRFGAFGDYDDRKFLSLLLGKDSGT